MFQGLRQSRKRKELRVKSEWGRSFRFLDYLRAWNRLTQKMSADGSDVVGYVK